MSSETALELLYRLGKNMKTRTGVESIDQMLNGGFNPGEMYELAGDLATGKTQILYSIATSYIQVHKKKVAWIDLNGSFVPSRFLDFVGPDTSTRMDALGRIIIAHAFKSHDLTETLRQILRNHQDVRLLLIDNIGSILTTSAWSYTHGGREEIEATAAQLKRCRAAGMTILLSNHLTRGKDGLRPALGFFWRTRHVTRRYLVGRDVTSRFIRPVSEGSTEDYRSGGTECVRFSIGDHGIGDFDDLSLEF